MRVLYLAAAYPLPANNGAKMRLWAVLRAIAAVGHEITLATFAEPDDDVTGTQQELSSVCRESDLVPLSYTRLSAGGNYAGRLRAIFSTSPFTIDRFRSEEMRARLEQRLRERSFDVIICDNVYSAINLPDDASPVVMNSQNIEYLILQRYVEQERNPLKALYARLEANKLRRFEAAMYRRAVLAMTCSSVDAEHVRRLCPGLETAVAPNVVDVREYEVTGQEDPLTVLYQGGMDWFPNRDAVAYFAREILPLVQKEFPAVRFIAAGRNPAPGFRAQFTDIAALEITGTLPDLRPVIAKAAVCVVPLRMGSGTRLKILEAGAMGKAMVSTAIGAEGLDFEPGKEILIADGPATFARHVVDLLRDPAKRKALGEAARNRVRQSYDITALEHAIAGALENLKQSIDTEAGKRQMATVG